MLADSISKQIACCISAMFNACQLTHSSCTVESACFCSVIGIVVVIRCAIYKFSCYATSKDSCVINVACKNCTSVCFFDRIRISSYIISIMRCAVFNIKFQQFVIADNIFFLPAIFTASDNLIGFAVFSIINIQFRRICNSCISYTSNCHSSFSFFTIYHQQGFIRKVNGTICNSSCRIINSRTVNN